MRAREEEMGVQVIYFANMGYFTNAKFISVLSQEMSVLPREYFRLSSFALLIEVLLTMGNAQYSLLRK